MLAVVRYNSDKGKRYVPKLIFHICKTLFHFRKK